MSPLLDPERTLAIVNPRAAGGAVGRGWGELWPALQAHLGPVAHEHTERVGHATEIARAAVERGFTTLLSLGGDGTHGEVTQGILASGAAPGWITLGILPAGTGGEFKRMLLGDGSLMGAARRMRDAEAHAIDVGVASYRVLDGEGTSERPFLNLASTGMSALVCANVNRSSKSLGGRATFFLATLKALGAWRPARVRVSVDGADQGETSINTLAIANGQFAGGGMRFAPGARLADGALDVTVIRQASPPAMLTLTPRLYGGTVLQSSLVRGHRGARVDLVPVTDEAPGLELDGEVVGRLPASFTVRPGAIRLIDVNPGKL